MTQFLRDFISDFLSWFFSPSGKLYIRYKYTLPTFINKTFRFDSLLSHTSQSWYDFTLKFIWIYVSSLKFITALTLPQLTLKRTWLMLIN